MGIKIILICAIAQFYISLSRGAEVLELVHVLYRHGDRTPIFAYPNDPYKDESKYWPEGLGQLTKNGKEMEYKLGTWLRKRFSDLVSSIFSPKEFHVVSTDYDRTLMSAQCVLASFYYPDEVDRFNKDVPWMPTPVHTSPSGLDYLLSVDASCPRIAKEVAKMQNLPEVKKFVKDHAELAAYLSEHTGSKIDSILSMDFLFDTLFIEKRHNLSLPDWTHGIMEQLKKVSDFSFSISAYTEELKRLRGGPLLGEISNHMEKKMHNNLTEKMFMYSAHDTTVAILLNTMGVFNGLAPPYAATVLVELYKDDAKYFVKMFYQNDSSVESEPHILTVPGCTPTCPLHLWKKLLSHAMPSNWDKECYRPDHKLDAYYIQALAATVVCGILAIFLFVFLLCWRCRKRPLRKPVLYQSLSSDEP